MCVCMHRHINFTTYTHPLPKETTILLFPLCTESLDIWREEGKAAIWLSIPIEQSHLIPCAAAQGFQFHHAEGSHSMMKLWLRDDKPDLTPRFATHQLGVSGEYA